MLVSILLIFLINSAKALVSKSVKLLGSATGHGTRVLCDIAYVPFDKLEIYFADFR